MAAYDLMGKTLGNRACDLLVQPRLLEVAWIAEGHSDVHDDSTHPVVIEHGRIRVPTGPGLGVVPDEGVFGVPVASFGQAWDILLEKSLTRSKIVSGSS